MMRTWRVAVLAGVVAALATACGGGVQPDPTPTPSPGQDHGPLDTSGIAVLHSGSDESNKLVFHDAATGAAKTTLELPQTTHPMTGSGGPTTKLQLVSPGWQYAAYPVNGAIQLYRLNAAQRRYEPAASFSPSEGSMTKAKQEFANPRFSPSGSRLYFDDDAAVYSVDYHQPQQQPAKEADLDPSVKTWWIDPQGKLLTWKDVKQIGSPGSDYFTYETDASGAIFDAEFDGGSRYKFVATVDATTVLMATKDYGRDDYGSLVKVKVDPATGHLDFTKIVDSTTESNLSVIDAIASPDKTTVLFEMKYGKWFAAPTTPGGASKQTLKDMPKDDNSQLLAWS